METSVFEGSKNKRTSSKARLITYRTATPIIVLSMLPGDVTNLVHIPENAGSVFAGIEKIHERDGANINIYQQNSFRIKKIEDCPLQT